MDKLLTLFYTLTGNSIDWRGVDWSGYLSYGGTAFAVCGLAWLMVRRNVSNLNGRRKLSSLIFALALTPAAVPVHGMVIVIPAFFLIVFGSFTSPSLAIVGCGSILFVWVLLFAARSLFAKIINRRERDAKA